MTGESTSSKPLVSVIVPTYNYGHFIGQMIESLVAQTYPRWECVIVDDGSTDDTREVVARWAAADGRVKYVRQENGGQPSALNTGLRSFTGDYLQILDADDLIEPRKLERQLDSLERHTEVDIVYGGTRYFMSGGVAEGWLPAEGGGEVWATGVSGEGRELLRHLVYANIMAVNAPLIRRRVVEAVGLFDAALAPVQDWDYWLRCALAGMRFRYEAPEGTLAVVRVHPSSSSQDRRKVFAAQLLMRKKLESLTDDPELLALSRERAGDDQSELALESIERDSLGEYLRQMLRAGLRSRRAKPRLKWLVCACAAPFLSRPRLRALLTTSLTARGR